MIGPNVTITKGPTREIKVLADVKGLAKLAVLVGVPSRTSKRKSGDPISNAQLAFLLTHGVRSTDMRRIVRAKMNKGANYNAATAMYLRSHGSAAMAIPPAPIIEPAIEYAPNKKAITDELKGVAQAQLKGDKVAAVRSLRRAGQEAVNCVQAWFDGPNGWPPNSPATIKRKGSSHRNVDTGQLRRAITYVLAEE